MGSDEHTAPHGHCPDCGTPYGAEDRFCGSCGAARLPQQPATVSHAASAGPRLPNVETPWLIGGAAVVTLAVVVGVVLLTSGGGGSASPGTLPPNAAAPLAAATATGPETSTSEAGASETSTSTYGESSTSPESPANGQQETGSTSAPEAQGSSSPMQALDSYWAEIQAHHFSEAYGYLASGSAGLSEARFVASEREAKIKKVQFDGEVTSDSGSSATVTVVSLLTHDAKYGCRTWSGSYKMTEAGEGWRIERAALTPRACSG